jgi:diaminopimelate decarboxylase
MNYKIKSNNNLFEVVETATNQIVGKFADQKAAKELLRHLNLGGGFDGWSPTFILKTIKIKK